MAMIEGTYLEYKVGCGELLFCMSQCPSYDSRDLARTRRMSNKYFSYAQMVHTGRKKSTN